MGGARSIPPSLFLSLSRVRETDFFIFNLVRFV